MNILRYFEGEDIKRARARTDDLKHLVEMAKEEQRAAEEKLRAKLKEAMSKMARPSFARALGRREDDND